MNIRKGKRFVDFLVLSWLTGSVQVSVFLILWVGVVVPLNFWISVVLLIPAWILWFWKDGRWSSYAVLMLLILASFHFARFFIIGFNGFIGYDGAGAIPLGDPIAGVVLLIYLGYHGWQRARVLKEDTAVQQQAKEQRDARIQQYKFELLDYNRQSLQWMVQEPHRFEPEAVEAARLLLNEQEQPGSG